MANNVIQYTSRTFEAILNDINNDNELIDKPNWWKRGIAGIGDVISMWNNAIANNILLRTSYTRKNVKLILELIDYLLTPQQTSNGIIIFYINDSAIFPFSVDKADLVALTTGNITVSSKRFEARSGETITAVTEDVNYTDVNTTNNTFTVTRKYITGERIRLTTSGTIPDPLVVDTNYYVIAIDATTIKLSTSIVNALNGISIDLATQGSGDHTLNLYSIQVQVYQQTSVEEYSIGVSDGVTGFQEFDLSDIDVLEDTLTVKINSVSYTKVETFINSVVTDKVFRLFYNTDNSSLVQLPGNNFGEIPPAFDIFVSYAYGGGSQSNVQSKNKITVYAGTNSYIDGVSNPTIITGGSDPETIEAAKITAPMLLKARDRFVTDADGEVLALNFGGISITKVIKNEYGPLSCKIVNIANGGGNLSGATKTALQNYLIDKTILESVDVRVEDATITTINVTSAAKMLTGYSFTDILPYFRLAWKLFFSEIGKEIKLDYESNGIESAVELINGYFSETFNSTGYDQIKLLIENLKYRNFEDEIQASDAFGYIDSFVSGIDYLTISVPSFPITLANDEITTYGILSLTEI
jgi:hypothetical protein